ncbi:MAG: acyl-[ACP]--phospholipid O-acyltransferase [Helicobacteraceae bacterium]|nr:acyl-[ACP]--phospholipid O-acyltransferase [Helicobacteraceae bacterium]
MRELLKIKGFLPFIVVMFVNASVDLAHKITIQNVLIKSFDGATLVILTALINAMILLPFIFLFSSSGFLNDKFSKTTIIRYATIAAIFLTTMILFCYIQGWFIAAFVMTFLLAIQSAIYSPAKYGLIKKLSGVEKLSLANGLIQALTIIAILLSSFIFSAIFESFYTSDLTSPNEIITAMTPIGLSLIILSGLEAFFAFKIPFFAAENEEVGRFDLRSLTRLKYLRENLKIVRENNDIWLSIIGLSIFWGVSQMILAAFPAHYKMVTGDDNALIIQGILAVSAVGVIFGSLIAGLYSKHHIELGIIPIGALGVFISLITFTYATSDLLMALCSLSFGFFGGLAIVPLNSVIQYFSKESNIGKILAGNNFMQNLAMVLFLILTSLFVAFDFSTKQLFTLTAILMLFASIFAISKLPHLFVRILLLPILKFGYKIEVKGIENLPPSGGVLLLGNHISWIDWLILQIASPRCLKFVMFKAIYDLWFLRWIFKFFDVIPISGGATKSAIENIRARLVNGEVVALFPEGVISYNGQIGKFERGFELAVENLNVPIIPFYLRGLWGSSFSRADDYYKQLRRAGKRDIIVAFGEPLPVSAKAREVKKAVVKLSLEAWDSYISRQAPLHIHWLRRAKQNPFKRAIADQASGAVLTNFKLIISVLLFIDKLRFRLANEENVGVLLPSSAAGAIVNLALLALGKKPINLNYTVSVANLKSAVENAEIKTIIASEKFVEKLAAKGFDLAPILGDRALYAENIKDSIAKFEMIAASLKALLLPTAILEYFHFAPADLDDVAAIIFSSGSESVPNGIELTHKNLLANIKQVADLINFRKEDSVLNSLPIFHSFGLTITTFMPLCEGIFTVAVPDPTDAANIGKMCAKYRVSILLGTSTFFRLYIKNKKMEPLHLQTVRLAIAGAEKLKADVKDGFKIKFGIEIYEGYGATETAPVVSVNMPDTLEYPSLKPLVFNKSGTVGLPLPGTIVKIVDPESLAELPTGEDGLILIGGSQVMKGYYKNPAKTAEVIVKIGDYRYYKSGDKGHIDEDGFVSVADRYSRFAKIGGEMISLTSVESYAARATGDLHGEIDLAAVALADEKKGEKIVLLFAAESLAAEDFARNLRGSDMPPLLIPAEIYKVDTLPKLASGKADFKASKELAAKLSSDRREG